MPDLLLEIGVEELPASYIAPALETFVTLFENALPFFKEVEGTVFATPRRMIFSWRDLPESLLPVTEEVKGPPRDRLYDGEGKPTKAFEGFLAKNGVAADDAYFGEEKGREYVFVRKTTPGRKVAEMIAETVPAVLDKLTFPRNMRWNDPNKTFARPVRWMLAMFGSSIVSFEWNGVRSGNLTVGHGIVCPEPREVASASLDEFSFLLREHYVVADSALRRKMLSEMLGELAAENGFTVRQDDALLDEVVNQLEWPNAVFGLLDEEYMKLPEAVLSETLRHHQYSFLLRRSDGTPAPAFVASCNLPGSQDELAEVRKGNENVCRARLADALFFYNEDLKRPLGSRLDDLKGIVFHPKLGSYYDKTERVKKLLVDMLPVLEINDLRIIGAALSRCDLTTHMVYELAGLQGTIGRHYALAQGSSPEVAQAIEEMYMPCYKGAELPKSLAGKLLSLADRLDTLAGFFAEGLIPTASRDPFALRRHTLAIIAILREEPVTKAVLSAFMKAVHGYERKSYDDEIVAITKSFGKFLLERLWQEMLEVAPHDLCSAVQAVNDNRLDKIRDLYTAIQYSTSGKTPTSEPKFLSNLRPDIDIHDTFRRLDAIKLMAANPGFAELCTTLERAANITRDFKASVFDDVDESILSEPAEKVLFDVYSANKEEIETAVKEANYQEAARIYVDVFPAPLHEFFEKVFVNVEDERIQNNRKLLLKQIYWLLADNFADLTLVTKGRANGG